MSAAELIPLERPGTTARTAVALHATGGDEQQLAGLALDLLPGAHLLAPRGQVMEGGHTRRFFARRSMMDLDIEDLTARADDLGAALEARMTAAGRDPARAVAVGYSNGANIAIGMLFGRPALLGAAVLLRPMLPYTPEPLPDLSGLRLFVAAGEQDPYGGVEATEALLSVLRGAGAEVTLHMAPVGHELTQDDLEAARAFVATLDD
ncbi:MAG: alpha/beta hydrolase [Miltoncostaeaceae bacterium]